MQMKWPGNLWRSISIHRIAIFSTAMITLAMVGAGVGGMKALSTTTFCTSCHSMSYPYDELQKSNHYGAMGVDPECGDCHVPPGFENLHLAIATHVVDGGRELYLELTGDYSDINKFNQRRLEMAHYARMNLKRWDSITCRSCHKNPRPFGEAKKEHEKMVTQGATCIDCHQNLVHKEVEETDLDASLAQGEMVLK